MIATILDAIKKNKDGLSSEDLKKETRFNTRQIADNVYLLKKRGLIKKTDAGLFVVA